MQRNRLRKNRQAALESLEARRMLSVATETTLNLSTSKSICGQDVTFTATVTPTTADGTPLTGTVKFLDGSTLLETAPVDSDGQAVINLDNLFLGIHSIKAKYKGNADFAGSPSSKQKLKVKLGATTAGAGADTGLTTSNADAGTGTAKAQPGDDVEVEYTGYLDDGVQFQGGNALEAQEGPYDLQLVTAGTEGQAIEGFNDGIIGMTAGQTRLVQMTPNLGYGSTAQSSIPANSDLNFIITLLGIQSSQTVPDLYVNASTGFPVFSGAKASGENDTDFGAVFTDTSVTNTFSLATGTTIGFTQTPSVVLAGPGAGAYTLGTVTLPTLGVAAMVPVTFAPTTPGVFNAKLKIFSTDPTNPTFIIKLRGDGVAETADSESEIASPAIESSGGDATLQGNVAFGDFQPLAQDFGSSTAGLTAGEITSLNAFAAQYGDTVN
ncbi:MAG TPA: Ig-like domain repeat protein [Tepidisphaeraceae bacterium]|nr:Ig-like domain repeat protein [Tepidisphaeraceae bacterium]